MEAKQSSHKNTSLVIAIACLLLILSIIFLYNKSQVKLPENISSINLESENTSTTNLESEDSSPIYLESENKSITNLESEDSSPIYLESENVIIIINDTPKVDRIETIQTTYANINRCKNCTDKEYKSSCRWLSLRYEKGILNKITIWEDVVGDFTITREFYLNNKDLLFIYEVIVDWEGIRTENRYYFENNKIIKQITPNSKSQFSFISNEADLINILNEIIERNNNGKGFDDILEKCG